MAKKTGQDAYKTLIRVLVVLVVPNLLNLAVYGWGKDAAYLRQYGAKVLRKLKRKGDAA